MTSKQLKELNILDDKRKENLYLASELRELCDWIRDGYKSSPAKEIINSFMVKSAECLVYEAGEQLREIIKRKKEFEK